MSTRQKSTSKEAKETKETSGSSSSGGGDKLTNLFKKDKLTIDVKDNPSVDDLKEIEREEKFSFKFNNKSFIVLKTIYVVFSVVNAYALYTYIEDLQTTKCECAINKQPGLNKFMVLYRYILGFTMIMSILLLISFIFKNTICKCE